MSFLARGLFLLSWSLCVCSGALFAQVVNNVGADGTLNLADGKKVVLVGIKMDEEGISILRVLVEKQDVKLRLITGPSSSGKEYAYVYLQSKSVKFPEKLGDARGEQEVLLNEFLIKVGAAKVAESQNFSHKAKFLKVQAEAKKKGEGVWSYELS